MRTGDRFRQDTLVEIGAGEGIRTLDPDLGKISTWLGFLGRGKGHRPGKNWPTDWGAPPESDMENADLAPHQRREWRVFYDIAPGWRLRK